MTYPKTLAALTRERSPEEVAQLRAIAGRMQERAMLNLRFAMAVESYREANPAAVSPFVGWA